MVKTDLLFPSKHKLEFPQLCTTGPIICKTFLANIACISYQYISRYR